MDESDKIDPEAIADETNVAVGDVEKVLQALQPDWLFENHVLRRNGTAGQLVADIWRFYGDHEVEDIDHRNGYDPVTVYLRGDRDEFPRGMHGCVEKHGYSLKSEFTPFYDQEKDQTEFVLTPEDSQ